MEADFTNPLVFQTDFGLVDGAVSAMYGVAYTVHPELKIHDLTHDITPYNIWEASYRLIQTISYWPKDTVFVSVVDPGVGSSRRSVVARTCSGHYIVTPDNGTLTHVLRFDGIESVREIDETVNRLPRSGESYTFHGRDVYAFRTAILCVRSSEQNIRFYISVCVSRSLFLCENKRRPEDEVLPQRCTEIYLTLELFSGTTSIMDEVMLELEQSVHYWREAIPHDGMPLDDLVHQ